MRKIDLLSIFIHDAVICSSLSLYMKHVILHQNISNRKFHNELLSDKSSRVNEALTRKVRVKRKRYTIDGLFHSFKGMIGLQSA